jgi:succinate-semialdehyde dehydrogenase/glutarate-semialdehyde dehydrogenase
MNLKKPELLQSGHYIDGRWQQSNERYAVTNPALGLEIASVARAGTAEAQKAIDSAEVAFSTWRKKTAKERSKVVRRWGELMLEHQHDLATILATEQGKPFAEAMGEVVYASSFLEWFAEEAKRVYGDVIPSHKPDSRIVVIKEPIGVVSAITPWNFPLAMITRKAGPAIAAGCTLVLKPSEETPLSALALAVLADEAGIPPGVFNVVSGDAPAIGAAFMASKVVRKVSFTGSTRIGKLLMRQAADTLKKLSLELGGNAPFIVFDDADIDAAVQGAMASKFRNTGQTCVCVNRFYVQDAVYDAFTHKLAQAVSQLKVADSFTEGATQGPLINAMALDKVETHVADAVAKGGEVLVGGARSTLGGTFYQPTVIGNASAEMMVNQEETFGPLAACFRFSSEEEVLALANDTVYGLSAYFYSRDIGRVWRVAEGLEAGIIGINEGIISTEVAPFGGVKESGLGREGSKYGIDDYVEIKYMLMGGI